MNTSKLPLLAIGLVSMLAGMLLFNLLPPDPPRPPIASETAIELDSIPLTDLDGKQTRIADWEANILIVNFWAPWCAPCRREVPTLIKFHRDFAERGVRVMGIAYDSESQVSRFADEYQINYPLFLAGNRTAMYNAAFGNHSGSLPFTALLDQNHRIVFQHNGELTAKQLHEQLEALL
ncbi:MAG: TlpA family protein disulfide reductase [Gammaproteobacteria bacterium]|nr:TlpA family protein disulfide reductase [Gammaproteobacteria bacterium]MDH3856924.1 TlpA family protein disulfide reductase [Gammaproteobacteria bacterium]